jgi:hypothetical protein
MLSGIIVNQADDWITSLVPALGDQPLKEGRDLGDVIGWALNTSLSGPGKEGCDCLWGNLSDCPDSDGIQKLKKRAESETWRSNVAIVSGGKTFEVLCKESNEGPA